MKLMKYSAPNERYRKGLQGEAMLLEYKERGYVNKPLVCDQIRNGISTATVEATLVVNIKYMYIDH